MQIPESDWRLLQRVSRDALNRFCTRVLDECAAIVASSDATPHERYLRVYRLIQERDESMAVAFNDLRRSSAIQQLGAMAAIGAVTDNELSQFSPATREAALTWAEFAGGRRRTNRRAT